MATVIASSVCARVAAPKVRRAPATLASRAERAVSGAPANARFRDIARERVATPRNADDPVALTPRLPTHNTHTLRPAALCASNIELPAKRKTRLFVEMPGAHEVGRR